MVALIGFFAIRLSGHPSAPGLEQFFLCVFLTRQFRVPLYYIFYNIKHFLWILCYIGCWGLSYLNVILSWQGSL